MIRLIKGIWHGITATKNAIGNLIFLGLAIFVLVAIFSSERTTIPESTALIVNPFGIIVDQKRIIDPFSRFLSGYEYDNEDSETLLRDVLEAIENGGADKRVKALVLDLHRLRGASMSKLEEIGIAIEKFKETGKPVYAIAPSYSQTQYFIAAHADKVYLDKQSFQTFGGVFFTGLGVYPTYFKAASDKLRINFHIFKAGLYKGAVEPFLRNDMSAAAREANLGWIGVLWDEYRDTIVKQRNITPESFTRYTNQYDEVLAINGNDSAQMAVSEGFVDAIISKKAWVQEMQSIVGASKSTYNHVSLKHYLLATRPPIPVFDPAAKKIAVITASGTIYDGVRPAGDIGGDSISKLIRAARNNEQVKALVVRIDSPGGSAAASELIRSELELTQDEGKPVVISMSGYAASGGYWIASTANKIFSADTTVTGSIGTFVIFPTFEESLSELGIHSDGVGTTTLSGAFNPLQKINPVLQKSLEHSVRHTYKKFIRLVAQGREMPVEDVDKIAQGRVWAGTTAVKLGLVDAIGNLHDAIKSAAILADVEDYEIIYLEQELTTTERLLNQLLGSSLKAVHAATGGVSNQWHILGKVSQDLNAILEMSQSPGIYLQCVYCKIY